jgi:hypothetical protein
MKCQNLDDSEQPCFLLCFVVSVATAQDTKPVAPIPAQYAATAVGQAGGASGKALGLAVYVDGLNQRRRVQELLRVLKQKGQNGVVSAMEDMKDKGRVAPTGNVGTGMRFVRIRPNKQGGFHIVLVTNRPITFGELYNSTRSRDYPFGIVVLELDKDGKGTFAPACKIRFNKKSELEIEHYGQKPFRLTNVYREK